MNSLFILKSLIFSQLLLLLVSAQDEICPPSFDCGYLGQINFPFTVTQHPHCGILAIHGCDDKNPAAHKSIELRNATSRRFLFVTYVDRDTIAVTDEAQQENLQSKDCKAFNNFTLPPTSPLASFYIKYNITMFRCNHSQSVTTLPKLFLNYTKCSGYNVYYDLQNTVKPRGSKVPSSLAQCTPFQVAVRGQPTSDPFGFLSPEIVIGVQISDDCNNCLRHQGGRCQLDVHGKFHCAKAEDKRLAWKLGLAAVMVVVGVAVLIVLAYYKKIIPPKFLLFRKENPTHRIIEEFLKKHGPLAATRYSHSDVKKITNSFKNKLGQGGYGSVYKGKLHDGCIVAVKVLSESKGNGEDFINEVASISRTSHVNIVRLLGFCLDGSKKALIYEFMPNGSLEKYIYEEKNVSKDDCQLDCKTLYDIAVGVARGLEYLHKGCNTRILHFDIKPHNILLDEDFCPKISDFGLARICPRKESIVSTFGARGTAGYIAPELFSRNFGGVSHKSDVYSYGMVVLEMVGRRKNIKVEVDCSSELYFPHWIYNRLELNQELGLRCIENEIDEEMVRKMTVVSLWCIQTDPSKRLAMHKVVEMLEGSLQVLEIPPKPFLSSPSTSPDHLSSPSTSPAHLLSKCL